MVFEKGKGGKEWNLSIEGEVTEKVLSEYKFHPQILPHQTNIYSKQTIQTNSFICSIKMSGSNDGGGSSWTSRFLKVAGAAAATAAVAGSLYAVLSSSSANSEHEAPFGARRESEEREHGATKEKWEKPEVGWVKLNVDGSRDHHNGPSAGCGGVLRDSSAKWVRGFAKKLDSSFEAHRTELEAILMGLKLASEMNMKKVVVESDNDSVVSMVKKEVKPNPADYEVVQQIWAKLDRFEWEVRLCRISNKANSVADRLANNARNLSVDGLYQEYPDPPDNCVLFLERDEMGCVSS